MAIIAAVVISDGLRVGHGVGQFEVAHDRASPWSQETRSAVRGPSAKQRKPPHRNDLGANRIGLRSAVYPLT